MPNPQWTSETDLFKDFTITLEKVFPWINQLLNGVNQQTPNGILCLGTYPYNLQNLMFSATYLKASLTPKFCQDVLHSAGLDATCIEVFICILRRKLHVVVSLQNELITKIDALDVTQQSSENIPAFNIKVPELCESIEQAGPLILT